MRRIYVGLSLVLLILIFIFAFLLPPYFGITVIADRFSNSIGRYCGGEIKNSSGIPLKALQCQEKWGGGYLIAYEGNKNVIHLTFDTEYENGYTAKILDTLKEKNATAVFFVTMSYAVKNPEMMRRMVNEGHVIANHTLSHQNLRTLVSQDVCNEIMWTHNYVKNNYHYTMHLFRPPYGSYSDRILFIAKMLGYKTVMWSFSYYDWSRNNQPKVSYAFDTMAKSTHPGAIYLLHTASSTSALVLSDIIDYWYKQGYSVEALVNK